MIFKNYQYTYILYFWYNYSIQYERCDYFENDSKRRQIKEGENTYKKCRFVSVIDTCVYILYIVLLCTYGRLGDCFQEL